MYRDDGQCDLVVRRRYAEPGHTGCQIVLVQSDVDVIDAPTVAPKQQNGEPQLNLLT
jgi:hypothetical protein